MSEKLIRLNWKVEHQHQKTFTPEKWTEWVDHAFRGDIDPDDLDAVYEELDAGGWQAREALIELATDSTWLAEGETQIQDLDETE